METSETAVAVLETNPVREALTVEDIRALREADECLCFDHMADTTNDWGNGRGRIRAFKRQEIKQVGRRSVYEQTHTYLPDLEYHIPLHSRIYRYHEESEVPYSRYRAYTRESISSARMITFVRFLKPGDWLGLIWRRDIYDPSYFGETGLHCDQLEAQVMRGKGKAQQEHLFLLSFSICKNNSARMIKDFSPF